MPITARSPIPYLLLVCCGLAQVACSRARERAPLQHEDGGCPDAGGDDSPVEPAPWWRGAVDERP